MHNATSEDTTRRECSTRHEVKKMKKSKIIQKCIDLQNTIVVEELNRHFSVVTQNFTVNDHQATTTLLCRSMCHVQVHCIVLNDTMDIGQCGTAGSGTTVIVLVVLLEQVRLPGQLYLLTEGVVLRLPRDKYLGSRTNLRCTHNGIFMFCGIARNPSLLVDLSI